MLGSHKALQQLPIKTALLIALGIGLFALSTHRQLGSYGVETDFYGSFVPEAQRLLAGESLRVEWHPPFYSFLLAGVFLLIGDWFRSGLVISVVSAVFAVAGVNVLFRDLYSRLAGWGAAIGLAVWPYFLLLAITASTDVLFLSLMVGSLAIAVGGQSLSSRRSFFAGVVGGLASLTRNNGITLLLLVLISWRRVSSGKKLSIAFVSLGGFLFPWALWFLVSRILHSPLLPARTYIDIATAFFNPEGHNHSSNSDNWAFAEGRFSSLLQVILFDPQILIFGVMQNVLVNVFKIYSFAGVYWVVLGCAGVLSILWLLSQKPRHSLRLPFWSNYAAQYAILGLRSFDTRYFLFLVPAIAAGGFLLGASAIDRVSGTKRRRNVAGVFACATVLFPLVLINAKLVSGLINSEPAEVIQAAALLKTIANGQEQIIARKPHVGFYSGLTTEPMPLIETEEQLYRHLCSERSGQKVFLFFGREEARRRPGLRALETPITSPGWLVPLGHGEPVGSSWVLYEVYCLAPREA